MIVVKKHKVMITRTVKIEIINMIMITATITIRLATLIFLQ